MMMISETNMANVCSRSNRQDIAKYVNKEISIISIIEGYGLKYIKESENRYVMLCPFHSESTPSLKIYLDSNTFCCFGCGEGSSVIDFIMLHENIGFMDVIDRYKEKVDVGSAEAITKKIQEKMFGSSYDLEDDLESKKYRLGIMLREYLKLNLDKTSFVDDCFYELDRDFNDVKSLDQEKLEYLYDEMLLRIKNGK